MNKERSTQIIDETFIIRRDSEPGVYELFITVGPPPDGNLNCCATFDYQIKYSGLQIPPQVSALGDDFGFHPDHGYITTRNSFGADLTFTFFGFQTEIENHVLNRSRNSCEIALPHRQ